MGSLRLAVARDEAFCFYYEENLREMERAGLETVFFSPLKDERLPEGAAGLYIGGGYPELHGERLEANESIRVDIKTKGSRRDACACRVRRIHVSYEQDLCGFG